MAGVTLARAGVQLQLADDAKIELGFRLQAMAVATERDLGADGTLDQEMDFKVRRARLRVGAEVTQWAGMFMQTEAASSEEGPGLDARVIEAYAILRPSTVTDILFGEHMVPANRENVTSTGTMLAMDAPGMSYKTLSWGMRAPYAFANVNLPESDSGVRGSVDVRDLGVTVFSRGDLRDGVHGKAYLGVYDGIQVPTEDNLRTTARAQVNFFDADAGYYNTGTSCGQKRTVSFGGSADAQDAVTASEDKGSVDYRSYSADAFAEWPVGPGSVTFETAWQVLDLGGATLADVDDDPLTAARDLRRAEGDGYYVLAGYAMGHWQPWLGYEDWSSNAPEDVGAYDLVRVGATYYIKGHNAKMKGGYERLNTGAPIGKTGETAVDSIVVGMFLMY